MWTKFNSKCYFKVMFVMYLLYFNIFIPENENAKGHISRESIVYEMAHQVRDLRTHIGTPDIRSLYPFEKRNLIKFEFFMQITRN